MLIYRYLRKLLKIKLHNYKNRRYWTKYYKLHRDNLTPSSFAQYCYSEYCQSNPHNNCMLELGCGNGRDAIFFMRKGINVLGLDLVAEELKYLQSKNLSNNLKFLCKDFSVFVNPNHYDYIYSRFTLHAITEEQETTTLKNSYKNLKNGGLLFIEARSVKDEMFKTSKKISANEGETDHYRRFLELETIKTKLISLGFELIEVIESANLSVYKNDNPVVIRIDAKKIV